MNRGYSGGGGELFCSFPRVSHVQIEKIRPRGGLVICRWTLGANLFGAWARRVLRTFECSRGERLAGLSTEIRGWLQRW